VTSDHRLIRRMALLGTVALGAFAVLARLTAAQTPSPALLISIEGLSPTERALEIADPLTNKVVGSIPLGGIPHDVAVSPDGKLAFVSINVSKGKGMGPSLQNGPLKPSPDYISVIDLATQKELRHIDTVVGSIPFGIFVTGGKLYFTAEGYDVVERYDLATSQIDWMMGTGQGHTHPLAVTKDLKKIFTVNTSSNSVSVIAPWDTPDDYEPPLWKVTTIPVGQAPEGIDMSPDEKEVWVTSKRDGGLSIIGVATKRVLQTLDLKAKVPMRLQFTPDGKRVIVLDEFDGQVLILDAVNRKEIKRIPVGKPEEFSLVHDQAVLNGVPMYPKNLMHDVVITPDGSRAYLDVMGSNRIDVLDLKTLEFTGGISTGPIPAGMAWTQRQ
jgi:YVTN family beta-propeller protein